MNRAVVIVAPLLLALLAACGGEGTPPVAEVPARWNTGIAADVRTLAQSTGTTFVGDVTVKTGQREEDRFPISVFEVRVIEAISGDISPGDLLRLEQPGGLAEDHDGRIVQVVLEGDEPIEPGARYLFFATQRDDGVYTTAPFGRFLIGGEGRVESGEEWTQLGASAALDGIATADAMRMVRDATP